MSDGITKHRQVELMVSSTKSALRSYVKRGIEQVATRSGLARLSRTLIDSQGGILTYHNVVPSGNTTRGESALHISQDRFAAHLDAISQTHKVVSLKQLLTTDGSSGPPRVAITFDDAYQGAVKTGLVETDKRGFPATIFVPPYLLGYNEFWWDRLADSMGTIPPDIRKEALTVGAGHQDTILKRWYSSHTADTTRPMPSAYQPCTVDDLRHAISTKANVAIASHTWSHRCLPACDESTINEELERPHRWLSSRFPNSYVPCVSFPYGRFTNTAVEVASHIYRWALTLEGRLITLNDLTNSTYSIPRINVPTGMSTQRLTLKLSGLF